MKLILFSITILLSCNLVLLELEINYLEIIKEIITDTKDLKNINGYLLEKHIVQTDDNYKLLLHRILHGKNSTGSSSGIPVLIMHSLFSNSMSFIDNLDDSLGFILTNEGFDVWLGNVRGNEESWHKFYGRNEPMFWDYSFEDMAEHDLPAIIDYIRDTTKHKKILYIGYSQGSLIGFILFASKPEYNEKVAGLVALGPILNIQYMCSISLKMFIDRHKTLMKISNAWGISEVSFGPKRIKQVVLLFSVLMNSNLLNMFSNFAGYGRQFFNMSRIAIYSRDGSESTSLKNLDHYYQLHTSNVFAKYNYGKDGNIDKYGRIMPPEYDTSKITVSVALFSAANDPIATPIDIQLTARLLRNVVIANEIVPESMFNHSHFVWAYSSKSLIYDKVISVLNKMWDANNSK